MAKLHVRHLVGGRAAEVSQERPCRFEFPERPGALLEFLDKLGGRWNISLFHYRNHGADFGRVLAAFEVPAPPPSTSCRVASDTPLVNVCQRTPVLANRSPSSKESNGSVSPPGNSAGNGVAAEFFVAAT